jgi:hypothetical protein
MPQTNVLADWKATYPADARAQKPPFLSIAAITAATWLTNQATFTTGAPHGLAVGVLVIIAGINPAGWNGTFTTVTGTTGSTIVVAMPSAPAAYVSGGALSLALAIALGATAVPNKPTYAAGTIQIAEVEAVQETEEGEQTVSRVTVTVERTSETVSGAESA